MNPVIITLASRNEGKLYELNHWLLQGKLPVQLVVNPHAPEINETGQDFIENAQLKAELTPPVPGSFLTLGEDSGMAVPALAGMYELNPFPGLKSNRWMTPEIRENLLGIPNTHPIRNEELCQGILTLMKEQTEREAYYCCGMALWHHQKGGLFTTMETTRLAVVTGEPRGENGFGYDPIVRALEVGNGQATMAELDTHTKNQISHRGKAFQRLIAQLQQNPSWLTES